MNGREEKVKRSRSPLSVMSLVIFAVAALVKDAKRLPGEITLKGGGGNSN
jgi:hypothetical protein